MAERRKVSVVGAGSVGATVAYASLIRGAPRTMALYDIHLEKVRAEVLDLNHGSQFYPTANVIGSDDIAVTADSDIVVITAGSDALLPLGLTAPSGGRRRRTAPEIITPSASLLLSTCRAVAAAVFAGRRWFQRADEFLGVGRSTSAQPQ